MGYEVSTRLSPAIGYDRETMEAAWMPWVTVDPDICGQALKKWGLEAGVVADTNIQVTGRHLQQTSPRDRRGYCRHQYEQVAGNTLLFHLGSAEKVLQYEGDSLTEEKLSDLLLRSLSVYVDSQRLGVKRLRAENRRDARRATRLGRFARVAAASITPAAAGFAGYMLAEVGQPIEHVVIAGAAGLLATGASFVSAHQDNRRRLSDYRRQRADTDTHPYQRRAAQRSQQYLRGKAATLPVRFTNPEGFWVG